LAFFEEDREDEGEQRWRATGRMDDELLLVVIHVFRHSGGIEKIRIISARKALPHERRRYETENG
jgi:uncharacterized DUF497 family protein